MDLLKEDNWVTPLHLKRLIWRRLGRWRAEIPGGSSQVSVQHEGQPLATRWGVDIEPRAGSRQSGRGWWLELVLKCWLIIDNDDLQVRWTSRTSRTLPRRDETGSRGRAGKTVSTTWHSPGRWHLPKNKKELRILKSLKASIWYLLVLEVLHHSNFKTLWNF